jgi:hypothetical protein
LPPRSLAWHRRPARPTGRKPDMNRGVGGAGHPNPASTTPLFDDYTFLSD